MTFEPTGRQKVVLAAIACSPGAVFAPVQVQKLFFLLDEGVAPLMGGKQFSFEPYDYGPFDKAVYQELDSLQRQGFVEMYQVAPGPGGRRYSLTLAGQATGQAALANFPLPVHQYMREVSEWVRRLSFAQLVGSIYSAFPEMRARSIFIE